MKLYGPYTYLDPRRQQRQFVIIVDDAGQQRTQSYARYLLEQQQGHPLASDEDADHIDRNPMNNNLSNLRILKASVNRGKDAPLPEVLLFTCPACGMQNQKLAREVRRNVKRGRAGPFCGRECARKWQDEQLPPQRRGGRKKQ